MQLMTIRLKIYGASFLSLYFFTSMIFDKKNLKEESENRVNRVDKPPIH